MSTLTDEDLTRLLDEVASSYDVPEHGPDEVLAAIADVPPVVPLVHRRWVQLSAAAAVVVAGAVVATSVYGGSNDANSKLTTASKAHGVAGLNGGVQAPSAGGAIRRDSLQPQSSVRTVTAGTAAGSASSASGGTATAPGALRAPVPAKVGFAADAPTAADNTGAVGAAPAAAAPPVATAAVGAPVQDDGESRVVKSGTIALVVKDKRVTPTISAVISAGKSYGGYVSNSNADEYGDTPSGEVTLRVPVSHFEDLVNKVRGLDAKVRTSSTTGKDVTAAYSDLGSQLKSLGATRDRFYLILAKTNTIGEILTVQQRIDNVSAQIDRIQGQRKLLADQSDLSTLTVSVSEAGDPVVKATSKPRSGISQAFVNAKDGFVGGVESIISHSGRALLWLLCLAVLAVLLRSGFRMARRRMV